MFAVAKDGRSARFGLELWGKQPVRFDLEQRRVEVDAAEDRTLTVARRQATLWQPAVTSSIAPRGQCGSHAASSAQG